MIDNRHKHISSKKTWKQYQKLLLRLQASLKRGSFQQLSLFRQQQLICTLKRYLKKLQTSCASSPQILKGSLLILALITASKGEAQTYVQPTGAANSLGFVDVGTNSTPAFVDIDGDGDLDAIVGNGDGQLFFFRNDGNSSQANFIPITGVANPFNGVDIGSNAAPFFIDIDNDGDQDAFIGEFNGTINFFRNDGNSNTPNFTQIIGAANPFDGIDIGTMSAPNFIDIDNDGDQDAFISGNNTTLQKGEILFFRNDGGNFTPINGPANPFNNTPLGIDPMVTFVDQDKDGDFDAFVGSQLGMIQYYQNIGNPTTAQFNLKSGADNPFNGVDIGRNGTLIPNPCFVDINGDGKMDVFIGNSDGTINFFRNQPDINCPKLDFSKVEAAENPLNNQTAGNFSDPEFIDIDNDGDADLFVGNQSGTIAFFRNEGDANNPIFIPISGSNHPLDGVDVGNISSIDFIDIDNDGDQDAFIGENNGNINFFRNEGNATTPNFQEITGSANPFNGVDVGSSANPVFGDIDNDGDFDAFIGEETGKIFYFRNDGNATQANFTAITDTANPFHGVDLETRFVPDLADIDRDGDLDAIIGNKAGNLYYFRNDGDATNPNFIGLYGDCNPFMNLIAVTSNQEEFSAPALVDINNDGALDLFVGQFGGKFCFIKQASPPLALRPQVPTLSEWGLISFTLLLLSFGTILIIQKESLSNATIANNTTIPITSKWLGIIQKPPINWKIYLKSLQYSALLALGLAIINLGVYGSIAMVDIFGTLMAGPIFAYLLHLILTYQKSKERDKNKLSFFVKDLVK